MDRWNIHYRGPLSSCNYGCSYCPFAKTANTPEELADDRSRLERFVDWVAGLGSRRVGILFTPWGEALVHAYYRNAIRDLSHLHQVYRVAIQTNLSAPLEFMEECNRDVAALWTTYHPTQVRRERFLDRCRQLDRLGARYSVGVVGLKEFEGEIRALREALDPAVYLWINAYKRDPDYYSEEDLARFERIDPHFRTNTVYHPRLGRACSAGHRSFTVDGNGDARRCHFVDEPPFANIYRDGEDFAGYLGPQPCSAASCGCHIGYVNLEYLRQESLYGDGILERIPVSQ